MKRFWTAVQAGLVLFAMAMTGTGQASELSTDSSTMAGACFMRATLIPRADDLALLQRKPSLHLASFTDGMATVAYSLENGRIVYRVVSGTIVPAAKDEIDRALVKLQHKLA